MGWLSFTFAVGADIAASWNSEKAACGKDAEVVLGVVAGGDAGNVLASILATRTCFGPAL